MFSKTLNPLLKCWKLLEKTKDLNLSAQSNHGSGPVLQEGVAAVEVEAPSRSTLVFYEKGFWNLDKLLKTTFTNTFRWSLHIEKDVISLEHLRYGDMNSVFLFDLKLCGDNSLNSCESHLCGQDTYSGNLVIGEKALYLHIRVIGPQKNQELRYKYF